MKKLTNIYLIGPMGSGKSTIGKQLAQVLGYPFFDSDIEIERRTGVSISWIFEIEKEEGFRQREHQVITELTRREKVVLATGGGVIVTPENCELLAKNGIVIYLTVSLPTQLQRTRHGKEARPLLACDEPAKRLKALNLERDPLYRSIADIIYNTDELAPAKLALQIQRDIEKIRANKFE